MSCSVFVVQCFGQIRFLGLFSKIKQGLDVCIVGLSVGLLRDESFIQLDGELLDERMKGIVN